jgi:hypothetical protein
MAVRLLLLFFTALLYAGERPFYQHDFDTQSTGVFLPVQIDNEACMFLFDTGASFVVLDNRFEDRLGEPLSLREAQARTGIKFASGRIATPNGEIELKMYKSIPMKLGRLQIANRFPYMLADLQSLWPFSGVKFCGILGVSFLHQFRWEIDFKKGIVKGYIGAEPYMGRYTARAPIFWSAGKLPQVAVNLQGREVAFDIDTGDNGSGRVSSENLLYLKKRGQVLKSHEQEIVTVSELSSSAEFRLKYLRFGDVIYPNIILQESKQNALGLAFFKRHDVVFDFPFNMLYLQHHKDYEIEQERDKSGVRIILVDGRLKVYSVKSMPGAIVKGLKKDDVIISINANTELSLFQARELLRQPEGTGLTLEVKRDGKIIKANIVLGEDPL